jgi:hypothetical protein
MLFLFNKGYLGVLCCVCLGMAGNLQGITKGAWASTTGGEWTTASNWASNPVGSFPNEVGDVAGFDITTDPTSIDIPLPGRGGGVTIASLVTNAPGLTINGLGTLTFDAGTGNKASIIVSQGLAINPTIILNSDMDIIIGGDRSDGTDDLFLGLIEGSTHLIEFAGGTFGSLLLSGGNTFGTLTVDSGILILFGSPNTAVIPTLLNIAGTVKPFESEQFDPNNAIVNVNAGGLFTLHSTTQTFQSLGLSNGGNAIDSSGTLTLTSGGTAVSLSGTVTLDLPTVTFMNPCELTYINNANNAGQGTIGNTVTADTWNIADGGLTVALTGINNPYDLQLINIDFLNGALGVTGTGTMLFTGNLGSLPDPGLFVGGDVTVLMGQSTFDAIGAICTVTVDASATLGGLGTLGTSGGASLINNGTLTPGLGNNDIGSLTLSGNFVQESTGTFFVQAADSTLANKLIVESGSVTLDGNLNFTASPSGNFQAGNQFIIIDSSGGPAITGRFSRFKSSVPDDLQASLIYNSNQVIVELLPSSCPPCPNPRPSDQPPTNLHATLIKKHERESFVRLTWYPSISADVVEYHIYKQDRLIGKKKNIFDFNDHRKITKGVEQYSVTSVTTTGQESAPTVVFFTP